MICLSLSQKMSLGGFVTPKIDKIRPDIDG
jgi:hypothetical protein